jgi:hypothetical protein
MGLFSRHAEEPAPQRQPVYEEPPKKRGLFGSKHQSPDQINQNTTHGSRRSSTTTASPERTSGGGIFRRSTDAGHNNNYNNGYNNNNNYSNGYNNNYNNGYNNGQNGSQRSGGLLQRFGGGNRGDMDPSIVQARERVMGAEAAELEADRALMAARESAREAREHVRMLEVEAKEDAKRAKIKQHHAKEFSKRGKHLGSKFPESPTPCTMPLTLLQSIKGLPNISYLGSSESPPLDQYTVENIMALL